MVGTPQIVIHVTPEQFEKIIEDRIDNAFQKLLASAAPNEEELRLPELFTAKQVCERLHITRPTLHAWAQDTPDRDAILVPKRVGKRILYKREDVLSVAKEYRRFKGAQG